MSRLPKLKRVLLKVSGEALMGEAGYGVDMRVAARISGEVRQARDLGFELCLVIGGGNIFRGVAGAASGMDRASADAMGMLATVINALAVQSSLQHAGVDAVAMSAIAMPTICEPFVRARALDHLKDGRVLVFAAGTGNPFFTTDTGAVLRAAEMRCDAVLKGTSVDGIYSADPKRVADAERYEEISFSDALANDLKIMDAAAIALARDNAIPVIVFSIKTEGAFVDVLQGAGRSTIMTGG